MKRDDEHLEHGESATAIGAAKPEDASSGVLRRALGADYERLHPRIRAQYELSSASGHAWIGRGVMERIWRGPFYVWPFLYIGSLRRIMFLGTGRDVPFTIENYAYVDGRGRETFSWIRTFQFDRPRRFDEWLVYSRRRGKLVVYAGTHQHLSVELTASVGADGALELRTGVQRIHLPLLSIRFPGWISGRAEVRESYNDRAGYFEIEVHVSNWFWGPIFGYRGRFELEKVDCATMDVPQHARPVREEARD